MDFEKALKYMKEGYAVARKDWDGRFLFVAKGFTDIESNPVKDGLVNGIPEWLFRPPVEGSKFMMPVIAMQDNGETETWQPTAEELLTEDWTRLSVSRVLGM